MLVLGIESTAHTFGVGIIDSEKREVIFHSKRQFKDDENGMDLRKLSNFHVSNFNLVLEEVGEFLKKMNLSFKDLGLIGFSQGPGIGNSLKIGALTAKTLALKYNLPIVGVNHIKAHLEIAEMLTGAKDPLFLYVSGVNTQIIARDNKQKFKIYGETLDIGIGNLFDVFAREIGLGFPGGPEIEKKALESSNLLELPYSVKGMDLSFGGMVSHLKMRLNKGEKIEDLCFSLQETAFAMLMEICERALAYTGKKEFVIVGGVAASKRLNKMAELMCEGRKISYYTFPFHFALDNGAMIAWSAYLKLNSASKNINNLKPMPYITIESEL